MAADWTKTWLPPIVVAVGLPITGLAAFFMYVSVNSKPLHPNPQDVKSAVLSAPLPKWADAVEQGRQLVRAQHQQNLPGLSVAVGVAGDIVWAEGFGWADLENRMPVTPDMRFRIGHVSKALTSAAVGLLREKGRLHLDAEIQEYVPAFPRKAVAGHRAPADGKRRGRPGTTEIPNGATSPPRIASGRPKGCGVSRTIRCCSNLRRSTAIRPTAGSW